MDNSDPQEGSSANPQGTKRTASDAGFSESGSPKRTELDHNASTGSRPESSPGLDPNLLPFNELSGTFLDNLNGILAVNETHTEAAEYFSVKANSITSHYNNAISNASLAGSSQADINHLISTRDGLLTGLNNQRAQVQDALVSSIVPSEASVTSGEEMGPEASPAGEADLGDSPQNSGSNSSDENVSDF